MWKTLLLCPNLYGDCYNKIGTVIEAIKRQQSNQSPGSTINDLEKFTDDDKKFLIGELKKDVNRIGSTIARRTFCEDIQYSTNLAYLSAESNADDVFAKRLIQDLINKKRADCLQKICEILSEDSGKEIVQPLNQIKAKLNRSNPFQAYLH